MIIDNWIKHRDGSAFPSVSVNSIFFPFLCLISISFISKKVFYRTPNPTLLCATLKVWTLLKPQKERKNSKKTTAWNFFLETRLSMLLHHHSPSLVISACCHATACNSLSQLNLQLPMFQHLCLPSGSESPDLNSLPSRWHGHQLWWLKVLVICDYSSAIISD